jgi:ATP-dependent DNA ligase
MHGIAEIFATATYSPLQHNRLIYAGRAGTGIGHAELERLWRRLQPLATPRMPLDKPPPRDSRFGSPLVLSLWKACHRWVPVISLPSRV